MKIRRIVAGLIAVAVALPMTLISSSAATIVITPSGNNKKYALDVTATAITSEITFLSTDPGLTMSPSGIEDSISGVLTSNSKTFNVKKVKNAKLNYAPLTSTSVAFGFQSTTNQISAGKYEKFTWTGRLTFSDETKHPKDDLGIDLSKFEYNVSFDTYIGGVKTTIVFNQFTANVVEESSDETFKKDTAYNIKNYINGGKGFTIGERENLKNGSNFKITVTLKDTVTSNGTVLVGFYTDLYYAEPKYTIAGTGAKTVTIDNIPKYYFYDKEMSVLYGQDFMFQSIYLTGAAEFTSVVLSYTEGTAATTTTTTTTTPGSSSTTPAATGDSAEDELYLNYNALTLNTGASANLKASYSDVSWSTSSRDIVRVFTSGKITAVAPGTATITGKNANGDKVTCNVTVINSSRPLTSYALNTTKGTVYVDSSYSISKAQLSRTDHTDKINWTSSDTSVATVNASGNVTIVGVGKATITATTSSGLTSTCVLTAKNPSLTLASSTATINVNGTVTIKPTLKPTNSVVTYESLNESVASVDKNGVVRGISKGTAKIQVTSNKGIVKIFTVTVS